MHSVIRFSLIATMLAIVEAALAAVPDIGHIKTVKGQVSVEREGQTVPAVVGARLQAADVIKTGPDGSIGITMNDDALLGAGPNTVLSLDRFAFDTTTNKGQFDTSLRKGSLAVISGRIAKETPDAMTIRTPSAILGARGTEFFVKVDE